MSRRQSLDRPGILSPPGPFLTPSPSPSISASPRLQPSPSLSPFPQDVLLVTGNPLTNTSTHEQERKAVTPGRRQSIHQFTNGSPNAGTVVFQPSPSQSPAAATSVIGLTAAGGGALNVVANFQNAVSQVAATTTATSTGNELNTTLVGSNNIQLSKKGTKRQQQHQQQQQHQLQQQQQQQHHQIFSSSSSHHYTTSTVVHPPPSVSSASSIIAGGYGQSHVATTINNTPNTFASTNVACAPKNQTKKCSNTTTTTTSSATLLPLSQQHQQPPPPQYQQHFQHYHSSSPLIADSPSPSPSGTTITAASVKPPTPQPPPAMQMLQQQFTIANNGNGGSSGGPQQTFQLIQGPQGQLIAAATTSHQQQQQRFTTTPTTVASAGTVVSNNKSNKTPQQILPKPHQQQLADAQKSRSSGANATPTPPPPPVTSGSNMSQASLTQISQSAQPGQQQQQIILPSGATASLTTTTQQPLLLNQVPVLVQQNTPQGVQLILRPPTPQLTATPSLVIQNTRPQPQLQHQHQQQPQQVLRILGTNGATMQLAAATPTFIVSSQANLIQQANHLQTIKAQSQNPAITQITGLHAALSAAANQQPRSQQFTTGPTINGHLLGPSVAAQLQNLQLAAAAAAANGNGLTAQIQMPNGLSASSGPTTTTLLSHLPGAAQFQQNSAQGLINLNQLSNANIQQLAAAAAAAGATFQTPAPPSNTTANTVGTGNNGGSQNHATTDLFSSNLTQSSPAHVPHSVTPEPLRQPTPVLQNISAVSPQQPMGGNAQIQLQLNAAATIQMQQQQQQQQQQQIQQLQQQIQQTQNQVQQAQQQAQALHQHQQQHHQQHQQQQQQQHQQQQQQQQQQLPQPVQQLQQPMQEPKKKAKPRKKKPPASAAASSASNTTALGKPLMTTANKTLNTGTSTTSAILTPTITSSSNTTTTKIVPILGQQQLLTSNNQTNVQATLAHNSQLQPEHQQHQRPTSSNSPPPQITRASNGKLDLGNVMKLCGITEDDDEDFMDTTPIDDTPQHQSHANSQDYTISIPQSNNADSIPFTLSIPGVSTNTTGNQNSEPMETSTQDTPAAANIVIKIDPTESLGGNASSGPGNQPYSITIPRLPSHEEIQKQAQLHLNAQNEASTHQQQLMKPVAMSSHPTNITFSLPLNTAPTLVSTTPSVMPSNIISQSAVMVTSAATNQMPALQVTTSTTGTPSVATTTVAVKPRRKPVAKRSAKKTTETTTNIIASNSLASVTNSNSAASVSASNTNITTSAVSTPLPTPSLVPSQIGNIHISQIDNRSTNGNQQQVVSANAMGGSLVENKIQIMPIIDNKSNNIQQTQLQQQHHHHQMQHQTQIVFQPNPTGQQNHNLALSQPQHNPGTVQQLVALPQLSSSSVASNTSMNLNPPTITMQQPQAPPAAPPSLAPPGQTQSSSSVLPGKSCNVSISVGTPNTIASLIPQLTGSLTLAVSEQCERLILRHDPNQPQDQQSQLILQALLKGALPNVTIINEPTKVEGPKQTSSAPPLAVAQLQPPPPPPPHPTQQQLAPMVQPVASTPNNMVSTQAVPNNKVTKKATKQGHATSSTSNAPTEMAKLSTPTTTQPLSMPLNKIPDSNVPPGTHLSNMNANPGLAPAAGSNVAEQRYVALPKLDPSTQQLFCLNTLNNQITLIGANQTAASVGPMERILIAPANINAQQLAHCLKQGQIHFNDTNPLPSQPQPPPQLPVITNATAPPQMQQVQPLASGGISIAQQQQQQQPKQQIVYPMTSTSTASGMVSTTSTTSSTTTTCSTAQSSSTATITTTTTTTTKQVANVAPIIDQSKAKQDSKLLTNNSMSASTGAVPKKKPVRKPKASTTTAADVALMKNASVVKPLPKLDPLSQKPNNNPVQIVQPNTASGKPVVSTSTTSTTTSTSNVVSIQPFQTQTSTGTKLVGVTAPMQQQPQQQQQQHANLLPQQQPARQHVSNTFTINFSSNGITTSTTTPSITSFATTPNNPLTTGLSLGVAGANNGAGQQQVHQQPQHTVSRVQTIQLTPQQQQMFKQVQMQIQYLTVKMQHKNLLSSTPLPADLDPNVVAAFNKPMTDMDINQALQRLFMEHHRILAAGKEIPTPEQFITNAGNMASTTTTSFNLIQTSPAGNVGSDQAKTQSGGQPNQIPANVVQPNNHSAITGAGGVAAAGSTPSVNSISSGPQTQQQQQPQPSATQKIHIYPIQQQQQVQQAKSKQQKPTIQQQQQQQPPQTQQQQHPSPQQQQYQVQQPSQTALTSLNNNSSKANTTATITATTAGGALITNKTKSNQATQAAAAQPATQTLINQTQNMAPSMMNGPQLPQLSSLSTTSTLPSLPFPSLPQPHMINIANMPAVLQQKHFTQHLQMQQQQLLQQQQQKIQISKVVTPAAFASFQSNSCMAQGGPPPLIFPASSGTVATSTITTTSMPQLPALTQQFSNASSNMPTPTFSVSSLAGNQKQFILSTSVAPSLSSSLPTTATSTTGIVSTANVALLNSHQANPVTITNPVVSATTTTVAAVTSIAMPQLVMATTPTITTPSPFQTPTTTNVAAPSAVAAAAVAVIPTSSLSSSVDNNVVVQNALMSAGVNVGSSINIVGNPINQLASIVKTEDKAPSRAKLARLSLFLQQLEADQQSVLNSDYKNPFQNKEEAVKRLIRYHCMYQNDEDIPSEEEEEFENTATRYQENFRKLSGKFQQILLQESMLQHRTSEICQMEKLMIDDLRQEIEDSKKIEQNILKYEDQQSCPQEEQLLQPQQQPKIICSEHTPSLFDKIKNEIKTEELQDTKLNMEMMHSTAGDSNSNFCSNLQNTTTASSFDSIKNEIKTESFDNSLASTAGGKSCSSSMDSFDLLKQSPISNNVHVLKNKTSTTNELKEMKTKEDTIPAAGHWNQGGGGVGYTDQKSTSSYYNNLPANAVTSALPKGGTLMFNGGLKKSNNAPTAPANLSEKKDSYENFDIESEITPTFIMKKVEHKDTGEDTPPTKVVSSTCTSVITTNTTTSSTSNFNKKLKSSKANHAVENLAPTDNVQPPSAHALPLPPQQNLQNLSSSQSEVITNSFDFSQHLPGNHATNNKQQDDDWLCLQKEWNLLNAGSNKNSGNQSKTLDFLSHESSDELFPNGCITKGLQQPAQLPNSDCNVASLPNSCSLQNQQPASLQLNHHQEESHHADLNEFFSGSDEDNSEVHKAVENRLESMFGESPVHLSGSKDRSDSPDDLDSIFGETTKSPANLSCNVKVKGNWDQEFASNTFIPTAAQHNAQEGSFMNPSNNMTHHIQLGSANNPRWMQNMEAQFPDFLSPCNTDCSASRKRQWNGHMVDDNQAQHPDSQASLQQQDDESPQKKMCGSIANNAIMNDSSTSSTSPLNAQQQSSQHHNLVPNDTSHAQDLMDAALLSLHDGLGVEATGAEANPQTNGYTHMVMPPTNFPNFNNHMEAQQQQQQSHFMNVNQQQQNVTNHMMHHMNHHHGHHPGTTAGSGEFDDDITRHVQNAIDSILNLQSSEADSLSFSLDHSMGALLGDTILNDNQAANNANVCHDAAKRRQLVDELGDCLMGGGNSSTDASNLTDGHLLMDTTGTHAHQQQPHHQHHTQLISHNNIQHSLSNHHMTSSQQTQQQGQQQQLTDFNCVVGSIDEAVKSIMTS